MGSNLRFSTGPGVKFNGGRATPRQLNPTAETRYNLRSSRKIPGLFLFDNNKGSVEGYLYYHSVRDDSFTALHMLRLRDSFAIDKFFLESLIVARRSVVCFDVYRSRGCTTTFMTYSFRKVLYLDRER